MSCKNKILILWLILIAILYFARIKTGEPMISFLFGSALVMTYLVGKDAR